MSSDTGVLHLDAADILDWITPSAEGAGLCTARYFSAPLTSLMQAAPPLAQGNQKCLQIY